VSCSNPAAALEERKGQISIRLCHRYLIISVHLVVHH
jgi:hypothetical protein